MAKFNPNKGKGPPGFQVPTLNLPFPGAGIPPTIPSTVLGAGFRGNANGRVIPLDIPGVENLALQYDKLGYDTSDKDFATRFPGLVAGRNIAIDSARSGIEGKTDPLVQDTLSKAGVGDLDFGSTPEDQSRNLGIADAAQRDRNYFQRTFAQNPQRSFGMNEKDLLGAFDVQQKVGNDAANAQYQSLTNLALSKAQQDAQTQAAIIGGLSKVGGVAANSFLQPTGYGSGSVGAWNTAAQTAPGGAVGYNGAGQAGYYDAPVNGISNFHTTDTSTSGGI